MVFRAPLDDILFTMRDIAELDEVIAAAPGAGLSDDTVEAILAEAARFAETDLDAIDRDGDRAGCRLDKGEVTTPPGWKETYRRWIAAGWNGVTAPAAWGGQDLPILVHAALQELWNAGSAAFAAGPMLTMGAIEALEAHASQELKALYLPKLVSGEWMATMNLTEPQAGSDLGAIRTKAQPADDGTYRIFGQKIFITYGEHDLTENIVHLVLARLPEAPPGTSGISLFVVPKFLPAADGSPGARNDVVCAGIENKLGLHGSPTCTLVHGENGGSVGFLVGEPHRGLAAMFTMMNIARLTVGFQGIGVASRAFERALAYAHQRRQGRAPGAAKGDSSPIVLHPDVQRDLLRMKALIAAARAIAMTCAHAIDMSRRAAPAERAAWADRASLLTPVAKAFSTDIGIEVASLGIQVHGGTGYIEETGAAQHLRDARIFAIYEGTNGIQAIDFATRRLRLGDGATMRGLLDDFARTAESAERSGRPELAGAGGRLRAALERLASTTDFLGSAQEGGRLADALRAATPYLRLFGLCAGAALLAKGALGAVDRNRPGAWVSLAGFFSDTFLDETAALAHEILEGGDNFATAAKAHLLDASLQG